MTTRTQEQNKRLHAMVDDIAAQLTFAGQKFSAEDWKRILLAAKYGQRVIPNPLGYGGIVTVNNRRSSRMNVEDMSEFLGEVEAFGATNGVNWSWDEEDDFSQQEASGLGA